MKNWIKINFYKIISILALFLETTGLIIGSIAHHKTNELSYYLDYDYEAHWGASIWQHKTGGKHIIELYFSNISKNKDDIKWDGIYPKGYFNN